MLKTKENKERNVTFEGVKKYDKKIILDNCVKKGHFLSTKTTE